MIFQQVANDIVILANAAVAMLDMISAALSVALIYLVFVAGALHQTDHSKYQLFARLAGFVLACVITLAGTHVLLATGWLLLSGLWLLFAGCVSVFVYWKLVRPNGSDDFRIPYTMMVWGGGWLLSLFALVLLWVVRDQLKLETDARLSLDTVVQIAGITITAVSVVYAYIMKSDQTNRTAKQEIYQTLELQSIELFRFEANEPSLVAKLWLAETPPRDEAERYQVKQYICQMLNLFEMAYRFRVQGIMAPEVFGSWVIWIWELCVNPVFQDFWESKRDDLSLNYIPDFRALIYLAISISKKNKSNEKGEDDNKVLRKEFFDQLGQKIGCEEIKKWLVSKH